MINEKASLVQIPSGYKSGTLYSVVPNTSSGDFTVTGDPQGEATRVNKDGLIESVAANVPRLNYDPSNPQDPHLLLEPERTNIAQNSNELNTGWAHSECTLTPNQVVAPDGSNTGSFVERTSTVQARVERGINLTDQNYTWSCFVKKGNQRYAFLNVYLATSAVSVSTIFDFDTESIVFSSSAVIANSVVEYSNGWYRLTTTFDALASQTAFVKVGSTSSTTVFSTGNVGDTIYVWGAQLEAGSYPTSYIPTTIAVTRTVDDWENTDGLSLSGDFTYFVHIKNFDDKTLGNYPIQFFFRQSASPFSYFRFLLESNERWFAQLRDNNASVTRFNASSDTLSNLGDNIKLAFAKSGTSCKYYVNGTLVLSSTITDFNYTFNRINHTTGNNQPAKLSQVMVFDTGLTDSELQTLTT